MQASGEDRRASMHGSPRGGTAGVLSKSMGPVPSGACPNKRRTSGMRCRGTPMPIRVCVAGRFTPLIISVTGCSTCRVQTQRP